MTTGHPPPPVARLDVDGFGDLFERFLNVVVHGRERPAPFIALLEAHFGTDPKALPVLSELMSIAQRPNLQVALDSYIAGSGRSAQLVGVNSPSRAHESLGFANLLQTQWNQTTPGAPEYAELALGGGRVLPSVDYGLYLVRDQDEPLAVLVSQPPQHGQPRLRLEILATSRERSSGLLAELRALMRQHNPRHCRRVST